MSAIRDRMMALLSRRRLPAIWIDLATYRRLRAMQERLVQEDPTLREEPDNGFEHVIYAAICQGLRTSEAEAGVEYNENTGRPA